MCLDVQTKRSFYSSHNFANIWCRSVQLWGQTPSLWVWKSNIYLIIAFIVSNNSLSSRQNSLIRVCPPQLSYISQFPAECRVHENIAGISIWNVQKLILQ